MVPEPPLCRGKSTRGHAYYQVRKLGVYDVPHAEALPPRQLDRCLIATVTNLLVATYTISISIPYRSEYANSPTNIPVVYLAHRYSFPTWNFCRLETPEYICWGHRLHSLSEEFQDLGRKSLIEVLHMPLMIYGKCKSAALQTWAHLELAFTLEPLHTLPVAVFLAACPLSSLVLRAVVPIRQI